VTGSLGKATPRAQKQEKTVPSALPKLILQIISNWISKRLLMMFINQVNQLRHSPQRLQRSKKKACKT
jgi:hypothetical protein